MVVGGGEKVTLSLNAISTQIHYIMRSVTDAGIAGAVIWNSGTMTRQRPGTRAGRAEGGGWGRVTMHDAGHHLPGQ